MKACGLIVEYNPFHNGHLYHIQKAKKVSKSDCMIAVMSGSFLQRGEPAIIDKFHRTKAALASGVDIVLELPYAYAVQSSQLFAEGAVQTLHNIGISSICFGSESGLINNFITSYKTFKEKKDIYTNALKWHLKQGVSFPQASKQAYKKIGLTTKNMDLSQPNNILGFSYVRTILDGNFPITPLTIKRVSSHYHEQLITSSIASATSIRKQILANKGISKKITQSIPNETIIHLNNYKNKSTIWHTLEHYFPFIHYRVMTMTPKELSTIHGVDEGLEYRIKNTAKEAVSLNGWIESIKTKRYTWTRLQRMFIHILTNTTKNDLSIIKETPTVPYIRILGMTNTGRAYINKHKKDISVPMITQLSRNPSPMLALEERASNAYYSVLPPENKGVLLRQELQPPIMI